MNYCPEEAEDEGADWYDPAENVAKISVLTSAHFLSEWPIH